MKLLRTILGVWTGLYNRLQLWRLSTSFVESPTIRGKLFVGGRGAFIVGRKLVINSSHRSNPVGGRDRTSIHIAPGAKMVVGDNVGISNSLFYAWESITLEDNVMIGGGCQVYDTDFHSIGYADRVLKGDNAVRSSPVLIREGAFVGANVLILKGVTVGRRSVIAAGSVVVKDIPDGEIWGGNPAKFIKKVA